MPVLVLINQYSYSYSCNNQVIRLVLTHIASTRTCTCKSGTRPSPELSSSMVLQALCVISYSCNNQVLRLVLVLTHIASTRTCTRTRTSGTRPSPELSSMVFQALCVISYPSVNSNWIYSPEMPNSGQDRSFVPCNLKI